MEGVRIETTYDPSTIFVIFESTTLPNKFSVTVPRYYPHVQPVVKSLDRDIQNIFIGDDGIVNHESLNQNWSALYSISTIVEILSLMRNYSTNLHSG
jgi:ubiquitin-protein ligase